MILSHRLYTATLIGLSGASVMVAMAGGDVETTMLTIAAAGAAIAGLPVAGLFGGRGEEGVFAAMAGAVMATGLGAMLAGFALALSTGFGGAVLVAPVAVAASIFSEPMVALTWASSMAGVHLLSMLARGETAY